MASEVCPAVLALQGSVEPHIRILRELGHDPLAIRRPESLEGVSHLIVPGGESTTLQLLLQHYGLWNPIRERGRDRSLAILGTCAGAILLARESPDPPPRLGLLDVKAERNAYGRQMESRVAPLILPAPIGPLDGVFIRSPRLHQPGKGVEVLGRNGEEIVLVRQGRLLAATFHPELTESTAIHRYFLTL